jgi:G3E family GTPase
VSAKAAVAVWSSLRAINSTAKILSCTRGQLPPDDVIGCGAFSLDKVHYSID